MKEKIMQSIVFNNDAKENTFSHKLPSQQFRQNCCVTIVCIAMQNETSCDLKALLCINIKYKEQFAKLNLNCT